LRKQFNVGTETNFAELAQNPRENPDTIGSDADGLRATLRFCDGSDARR
jgi:hypothetical protein